MIKKLIYTGVFILFSLSTAFCQKKPNKTHEPTDTEQVEKIVQSLNAQINLSEEQIVQIRKIFETSITEMNALKSDYEPEMSEMNKEIQEAIQSSKNKKEAKKKMEAVREKYSAEISSMKTKMKSIQMNNEEQLSKILSEKQQRKLAKFQQKQLEKMQQLQESPNPER